MWEALAEEVEKKQGKLLDPFDLICHVAFDQPALSRRERADQVKKRNYFAKYLALRVRCSRRCSTSTPIRALSTLKTSRSCSLNPSAS